MIINRLINIRYIKFINTNCTEKKKNNANLTSVTSAASVPHSA